MKKIMQLCLMCFMSLSLVGCSYDYKGYIGDYPELFSIAVNSIPDARGAICHEVTDDPVVQYLEEDSYGRVMFCYSEAFRDMQDKDVYLVVCQGHDDTFAYYYRDINFISAPICEGNYIDVYGGKRTSTIAIPYNDFTEDEILKLKIDNDWGKELKLDNCNKVKIVRRIN